MLEHQHVCGVKGGTGVASVVELVDTRDLKSLAISMACGFDSRRSHHP